jgi:hypothetical protein
VAPVQSARGSSSCDFFQSPAWSRQPNGPSACRHRHLLCRPRQSSGPRAPLPYTITVSSGALSNMQLLHADTTMHHQAAYVRSGLIKGILIQMTTAGGSPVARAKWTQIAFILVSLPSLSWLTACVGSPRVLAQQPTFELNSPAGLVGVSIRSPLPGRTDSEFEALVKSGMLQAIPNSTPVTLPTAPFPQRRLVWHVSLDVNRGTSRLILNVFEGSRALTYDQEHMGSDASKAEILAAVESMTQRLDTQSAVHSAD